MSTPLPLPLRLAIRAVHARHRDQAVADLLEEWQVARAGTSRWRAQQWAWREAARFVLHAWWESIELDQMFGPDGVLRALTHDVRTAARSLARAPSFTLLAGGTMTAGLAAAATLAAVLISLWGRPMPFADPDQLVRVEVRRGGEAGPISLREIEDIREHGAVFAGVAAYVPGASYSLSESAEPEKVSAILVTANLFDVLGVRPMYGAPFPESYDRERHDGLILSHGLWTRQFARSPLVVGRTIAVDATAARAPRYEIAGVMPEGFDFPARTDVYRSLFIGRAFPNREQRDVRNAIGIARLADGVTVQAAADAMRALSARLAEEFPTSNRGVDVQLTPLADYYTATWRPYRPALLAALGALVLLVTANITGLFQARLARRAPEFAVHRAIGATRAAMVRRTLAEGVLLGAVAGALSAFAARAAITALRVSTLIELPPWMDLRLGPMAMAVIAAAGVGIGLAAVVPGAWRSTGAGLTASPRVAGSRLATATDRLLIGGQVALAVPLVVGAVLLFEGVRAITSIEPGFSPHDIMAARVALPVYLGEDEVRVFHREVAARLEQTPGVVAGFTDRLPFGRVADLDPRPYLAEGEDVSRAEARPGARRHVVTTRYFEAMRIPLVAGRSFDDGDRPSSPAVAVIEASLARRLWPDGNAIGRRLRPYSAAAETPWLTVVGVAADVRHDALVGPEPPVVYVAASQFPQQWMHVVARGPGLPSATLSAAVAEAVHAINPHQPVDDVASMEARIADSAWPLRVLAGIMLASSALSLLLSVAAVHAATSFAVGGRLREFAVRAAVGASPADLLRAAVGPVARTAAAGVVLGLLLAVAGRQLAGAAGTPKQTSVGLALAAGALVVVVVTFVAAVVPARRATRVDPASALRPAP